MPRKTGTLNGSAANGHVRNPAAGSDGGNGGLAGVPSVLSIQERVEAASIAFLEILSRDDGWLRAIPAGEGKQSYFKWKFTSGVHRNHYVMYVAGPGGWTEGILGLREKLLRVDEGDLRPAYDSPHDPR